MAGAGPRILSGGSAACCPAPVMVFRPAIEQRRREVVLHVLIAFGDVLLDGPPEDAWGNCRELQKRRRGTAELNPER